MCVPWVGLPGGTGGVEKDSGAGFKLSRKKD